MEAKNLEADLEILLASMARVFRLEGKAREVAVLAASKASMSQCDYDNWNGGTYSFAMYLEVSANLFMQIEKEREGIEKSLLEKAQSLAYGYEHELIASLAVVTELKAEPDWRDDAKRWLTGQGVNNQG